MADRLTPVRMTANALNAAYDAPRWIKRMNMNDRVNFITRVISETCADNWYLYIETAVETLPMLIFQLKAVSKVDVIKQVLEARYGCGLRQALGAGKLQPRTFAQKAKAFFWKIEGVRGQLVWWWIVIDASTIYLVNWASIVQNEQRCTHPPHAGPCILDQPGSSLGSILGSYTLFYDTREFDPSHWSGTIGSPTVIAPLEAGTFNVGASVSCVWGTGGTISWHLEIVNGIGNVVATSATVTGPCTQSMSATCFGTDSETNPGAASYTTRVVVTQSPGATFGHCTSGTFSVGLHQ